MTLLVTIIMSSRTYRGPFFPYSIPSYSTLIIIIQIENSDNKYKPEERKAYQFKGARERPASGLYTSTSEL